MRVNSSVNPNLKSMQAGQYVYEPQEGWKTLAQLPSQDYTATLSLVFGDRKLLSTGNWRKNLPADCSQRAMLISSTSGEIMNTSVLDGSVVITSLGFEKTTLREELADISQFPDSFSAGADLGHRLLSPDLQYVLIVSDGQRVNGSQLIAGISRAVGSDIPVTGGLAGDAARFEKTLVGWNDRVDEGVIVAVGFYGNSLQVGHGSVGGWEMFGPDRMITRSADNVLYELDGKNALELYKRYLGPHAKDLPGSGLLFPLNIWLADNPEPLTRTILNVDEETQSMVFAGDMPSGSKVRFMKANFDKLIEGSEMAAQESIEASNQPRPRFALLISCVGRKLILGQRIEEEVEVAKDVLGPQCTLTGFYSYGEICPTEKGGFGELHNQTMTITTLDEL